MESKPDWGFLYTVAPISVPQLSGLLLRLPSGEGSGRVALVIDEVDDDLPTGVAQALVSAIKRRPGLRVVVSGRCTRVIEERAQRARVKTTARFGESLMASIPEAVALAEAWGYTIDEQRIPELVELTGGWLEPMRLILDGACAESFDVDATARWIKNVAFDGLSDHEFSVMDQLSLMERVDSDTAALAGAGIASPGSGGTEARDVGDGFHEAIASLRDRGLVRSESGGGWTTSSPLVRSVLDERMRAVSPSVAEAIHTRIARRAYSRDPRRFAKEILRHGRSGKAWALLEKFWEEHGSVALATHARETRSAYSGIPEHITRTSVTLTFAAALSATDTAGDGALELLARYSHQHTTPLSDSLRDDTTNEFIETTVIRMLQLRRADRLADADELGAQVAGEVNQREDSGLDRPSAVNSALLLIQRAITRMLTYQGHAPAVALARRALQYARESGLHSISASIMGYLALLQAVAGRSDPSRIPPVAVRLGPVGDGNHSSLGLGGHLARTLISIDRLDHDQAVAGLSSVDTHADAGEFWTYVALIRGHFSVHFEDSEALDNHYRHLVWAHSTAREAPGVGRMTLDTFGVTTDLRAGRVVQAERRVEESKETSDWMMSLTTRMHLSKLDYPAALRSATGSLTSDLLGNRERSQLLLMAATSSAMLGQDHKAVELFNQARSLVDSHGLVSAYLMISHEHRRMLLDLSGDELPADVADRLGCFPDLYPESLAAVSLSAREQEILQELAQGDSHRQIAQRLFISIPTVRTHIRTLYSKLEVSDREAAISRARDLGLLGPESP